MEIQSVAESSQYTQTILDSITDGVFTTDANFKITSFNRAASLVTGIPCATAIGQYCFNVFRASVCEKDCPMRFTMRTGRPVVSKKIRIMDAKGEQVPISVSTALLRNPQGETIGGVETFRDRSVVQELRKKLDGSYSFHDIISKNAEMLRIFRTLPQIAESGSCVLIDGDSGTGKELFAQVIHNLSGRRRKPLVAVNCGALPDTLLESELFGYKAGAFTDARRDKQGRFAQARGGTILLDEIGDISPAFQIRLLRVLENHVYEPLGSTHSEKSDVRVIASTNKNLLELVEQGRFRRDLYYRINVIRVHIPPLLKRKEDIARLVQHFVTRFNRIMGKSVDGVSGDVMRVLMKHDYPGNVRELENIIEHAMVLCLDSQLEVDHLPSELFAGHGDQNPRRPMDLNLEAVEREQILDALNRNHGNRQAAARDLEIHKTTLFRKVKALGISLPTRDGRHRREFG